MKTSPSPDDLPAHDPALDSLFAAARSERPNTSRAEYGFETRLLARLSAERMQRGGWMEFAGWCWRLAPAFAVVTLAAGLWTWWPDALSSTHESFFTLAQPLPGDDDDHFAQWLAVEWLAPI